MFKKIILALTGVLLVSVIAFGSSAVFAAPARDASSALRADDDPPADDFAGQEYPDWFVIASQAIGVDEETLWESIDEEKSIADIGKEYGVSQEQIISAIISAEEKFIQEYVLREEISQEEADEWLAYLPEDAAAFVSGILVVDTVDGNDWFNIVSEVLPLDENALWEALDKGQSIAEVAEAQGVSVETLRETIVSSEEAFINRLVTEEKITAEEADEWFSDIRPEADLFLNENFDFTETDFIDWNSISINVLSVDEIDFWDAINSGKSIAELAKENGVATDKIAEAIIAAEQASVKNLVAEELLTQNEADEWLLSLDNEIQIFLTESWNWNESTDWFALTLETLNVNEDMLWQALEEGKSIAEFAAENGVSSEKLVKTIAAAEKNYVNELIADGNITQDEAELWLGELDEEIQNYLDATWN